jgi:hypothetical protein
MMKEPIPDLNALPLDEEEQRLAADLKRKGQRRARRWWITIAALVLMAVTVLVLLLIGSIPLLRPHPTLEETHGLGSEAATESLQGLWMDEILHAWGEPSVSLNKPDDNTPQHVWKLPDSNDFIRVYYDKDTGRITHANCEHVFRGILISADTETKTMIVEPFAEEYEASFGSRLLIHPHSMYLNPHPSSYGQIVSGPVWFLYDSGVVIPAEGESLPCVDGVVNVVLWHPLLDDVFPFT